MTYSNSCHRQFVHVTGALLIFALLATSETNAADAEIAALSRKAKSGDVDAMMSLGVRYRDGKGVKRDYGRAVALFREAVKSGNPRAQDHLGWMHFRGHGVPVDYAKARTWFEKAAAQKFGQAQWNLARIYASGLGVKQDHARAVKLWRQAAESGHAQAPFRLAQFHRRRLAPIPRRTATEPLKWARLAAERGNHDGRLLLGWMHYTGEGVPHDPWKAHAIWRDAYKALKVPDKRITMMEYVKLYRRPAVRGRFNFRHLEHQVQGWNMCAPTAASMAMSGIGRSADPYGIKATCEGSPPGTGTDWASLVGAINKIGLKAKIVTFPRTDDGFEEGMTFLRQRLGGNMPVLVDIRDLDSTSNSAHTVVAVGFDEDVKKIILQDPALRLPGIRMPSYKEFKAIWHSRWYSKQSPGESRPLIVIDS